MFIPALQLARDPERGGKNFLRLLGRAYADPAPFIRQFLSEQYAMMIARFKAAFAPRAAAAADARSCRGACTSSWARCRTRWRAPTR